MSSCPRCRGFLYANRDRYGNYDECLQCGYMVDFAKLGNIRERRPSYVRSSFASSDGTKEDPIPRSVTAGEKSSLGPRAL